MKPSTPIDFARELVGAQVSLAWRGAGTAIFLELGKLEDSDEHRTPRGSLGCIGIEWSWRIEQGDSIIVGSFSEDEQIQIVPELLNSLLVEGVSFFGRIPEIEIQLSKDIRLLSFSTVDAGPQWSIRVAKTYLTIESGRFVYESAT